MLDDRKVYQHLQNVCHLINFVFFELNNTTIHLFLNELAHLSLDKDEQICILIVIKKNLQERRFLTIL